MLLRNSILMLLDAFDGSIRGKTLLQKRLFFLQELLSEPLPMGFRAHYFGPYSDTISEEVGMLRSSGLVEEAAQSFGTIDPRGFERSRYDYRLTEDGKAAVAFLKLRYPEEAQCVQEAVARLRSAGDPDYMELSIAAKAYFILRNAGDETLELSDVAKEAKKFGWDVTEQQIKKAAEFLQKLDLVHVTDDE